MFPANRLPLPVYIEYTSRGKRVRKLFANGLDLAVRRFYAAKMKQGKNPKVINPETEPSLFPTEGQQ